MHDLERKGTILKVLAPAINTGGPMGRMILTVLGMVAEIELGFIRDRQRAGIDAAKTKGVCKGRPVAFERASHSRPAQEGMGATEIAKAVRCKRGNVYKTLKAAGLDSWKRRDQWIAVDYGQPLGRAGSSPSSSAGAHDPHRHHRRRPLSLSTLATWRATRSPRWRTNPLPEFSAFVRASALFPLKSSVVGLQSSA